VDKEIARLLGISSWTVHEHVKRIFDKLHVHSRVEAALAYLQK
jgi:DNA-binding NarL/FixJ family response regulator